MKAIMFKNEIITLENFFSAHLNRSENAGTMRNPRYLYGIKIQYTNTEHYNYIGFEEDKALAEKWLNKIFEIISKEEG